MKKWWPVHVSLLLIVFTAIYALYWIMQGHSQKPLGVLPFNEIVQSAVTLRLSTAGNLFQVTLIIFAAIWGLTVVTSGIRIKLFSKEPGFWCFVLANVALFLSIVCYWWYCHKVAIFQATAGQAVSQLMKHDNSAEPIIVDLFGPRVNYLCVLQSLFLFTGSSAALLAFFCVYPTNPNQEVENIEEGSGGSATENQVTVEA